MYIWQIFIGGVRSGVGNMRQKIWTKKKDVEMENQKLVDDLDLGFSQIVMVEK